MVSAQLLEKDRAKIPKKVPFFFIYGGILLYNVRIVHCWRYLWEVLSLMTGNPPSSMRPWHQSRDCHLLLEVACFQPLEGGNLPVDCHPSLFQCCCCLPRLVGAQICRSLFFLPTPGRKTEGVAVDCRNFCLSVTSTRSRWQC